MSIWKPDALHNDNLPRTQFLAAFVITTTTRSSIKKRRHIVLRGNPFIQRACILVTESGQSSVHNSIAKLYGCATNVAIRPLDDEKAVHVAANLLGDLFMFTVAGAAVIFEVQRNSRSEARKEAQRRQELEEMKQRDEDLAQEIEFLKHKLEEVEQLARG